jgi:hypothetical protein
MPRTHCWETLRACAKPRATRENIVEERDKRPRKGKEETQANIGKFNLMIIHQ